MLIKNHAEVRPDGYLDRTPWFQFILLALLFSLWATAASLNDILITAFKSVFTLSDVATAFVQSAFYLGYFVIAIPAARVIRHFTYKTAIIIGLVLYIAGALLFLPASHAGTYAMFLVALFVLAVGLSFLETSANTYGSMMGPKRNSTQRLNIAQTFYPLGSILGIVMGKYLVFGAGDSLEEQLANAAPEQQAMIAEQALQAILQPYKVIIVILVVVLVAFLLTEFPSCKPRDTAHETHAGVLETLRYLFSKKDFVIGILTQFVYIGMQTAVWSFTIRLALEEDKSLNERAASTFMIISFALFFVGRGAASSLMSRFRAARILQVASVLGVLCMAYVVVVPGITSVYAAVASVLFFAPCWPTIYGKTLETITDARYRETGGAIIVMSIIGGAVQPVLQGLASDMIGSLRLSFVVPLLAYVIVLAYFTYMSRRGDDAVATPAA